MTVLSLLKTIDAPGSLLFLAVCVVMGLVAIYVWPRSRRFGRIWLLSLAGFYVCLALPCVANVVAGRLPPVPASVRPRTPIATLVVLDGDNRDARVREAVKVFAANAPETVWLVGNLWMLDPLQQAGIRTDRLRPDQQALTTREQVDHVGALVARKGSGRTAVIASRLQMPRIAALIEARDIAVALIASPVDREPATTGLWQFVPTYGSLSASRDALYEHAALAYYRWNGWIR